jgi:hypothetical protein
MLLCPGFALGTSGLAGSFERQRRDVGANRGERREGFVPSGWGDCAIQRETLHEIAEREVSRKKSDYRRSLFGGRGSADGELSRNDYLRRTAGC